MPTTSSIKRPRISTPRGAASFAAFTAVVAGTALLGSAYNPSEGNPDIRQWYAGLEKARLQPPPEVFGPVWSVLYTMIAIAGWRVYRSAPSRERTTALELWAAQLALNGAWSPLFFGARKPTLSMTTLAACLAATGMFAVSARKIDVPASRMMLPYIGWLIFAGYLNAEIVRRNG